MNRILALSVLSVATTTFSSAEERQRPPDIVVFLADDLSASDLPLYEGTNIETPAIDRLAADGMTFDRAFVASPLQRSWCSIPIREMDTI